MKCPRCGYDFSLALKQHEQDVLMQLSDIQRFRRGPVPTAILADLLHYTPRYTRMLLTELERMEVIERRGMRGGWLIARREDVIDFITHAHAA